MKEIELKEIITMKDSLEVIRIPYDFISEELIKEGIFPINSKDFLINDLKLTLVLSKIFSNNWAFENLAFKGGTCLAKHYLDYYRFSKDIDLSFIPKENSKPLRNKVDEVIVNAIISLNWKVQVIPDIRSNYRLYKISTEDGSPLKLSVTFKELHVFPFKTELISVKGIEKLKKHSGLDQFNKLFDNHKIQIYDEKEILLEKYRCVLTRKQEDFNVGRDLMDLFMLNQKGIKIPEEKLAELVVKKILRSKKNGFEIKTMNEILPNLSQSVNNLLQRAIDSEQELLIKPINKKELEKYVTQQLLPELELIKQKLI